MRVSFRDCCLTRSFQMYVLIKIPILDYCRGPFFICSSVPLTAVQSSNILHYTVSYSSYYLSRGPCSALHYIVLSHYILIIKGKARDESPGLINLFMEKSVVTIIPSYLHKTTWQCVINYQLRKTLRECTPPPRSNIHLQGKKRIEKF